MTPAALLIAYADFANMKRYTVRILLTSLLLAACGTGDDSSAQVEATDAEEHTVVMEGRAFTLQNYNGAVTITGRNDSTATLAFQKQATAASQDAAQALLETIRIEAEEDTTRYTVHVQSTQQDSTSVEVQATVPYQTPVRLGLENGTLTIEAVSAPIEGAVQNGSVEVRGATGALDIETGNGDISVTMAGFKDSTTVALTATNGTITLALPANVSAVVEAETQVGQIETSGVTLTDTTEERWTTGGSLRGVLGKGTGRITLRTQNGSIVLQGGP